MKAVFFYLGLGALLGHELDAVANHEWRVLPLTAWLDDATGETVFILAHVPLFAVLIALVASLKTRVRRTTMMFASAFLVVHAGLHALFSGHEAYEFEALRSDALIWGAAACGALVLVLEWGERRAARGEAR